MRDLTFQQYRTDPSKFFGKRVHTTDDRWGHVVASHPIKGNLIGLEVRGDDGWTFYTDSEHCTIVREGS